MKKLVIFVLFLGAAAAGGYYYFVVDKVVEKPTVNRAPITRGEITEVVQSTGTLEPMRTVQVGSQVSGVVQWLGVDFNSIVTENQVIARIDPTLLELQVKIQEANIKQREGDIENQKVQLEQDQRNLKRTREQVEKGLLNQQQLENAELSVRTREASISNSQKGLLSLEANLEQAKQNVAYTTIKSPVDGVVVNRLVDVGQTVQASLNTPQFFTIAQDLRELKLSAGVDEAEIGKVQVGQRVMFNVDAWPGQEFEGIVDTVRLNATNQNNVVTYPVWIKVQNNQLRLKPSMTATIRIVIQSVPNVLKVPNGALRWKPTNEIYTALGLTPPAPGRPLNSPTRPDTDNGNGAGGGKARDGGRGANAQVTPGSTAAPGSTTPGAQPGTGPTRDGNTQVTRNTGNNAQPGQNRAPGTGFGRGNTNPTPEERQAMMERFARGGAGGRGGAGRNRDGAGSQGGGRGLSRPGSNVNEEKKALDAKKIDELFEPVVRREMPGKVWTWDEEKKELKEHDLRVGVTDGTFSEIIRGDGLDAGMMVVTGVVMPQTSANRPGQGPGLFGNQPGMRNPGGMTPGGGGNPGGGGRGGGGGGGGRGGGGGN